MQRAEPSILAIEAALKRIAAVCDLATDAGCRHAFVATVVDAIDQDVNEIISRRNDLAQLLGWPSTACGAVICSSRWNKETAGLDASGKERQRSRKRKDTAGEPR